MLVCCSHSSVCPASDILLNPGGPTPGPDLLGWTQGMREAGGVVGWHSLPGEVGAAHANSKETLPSRTHGLVAENEADTNCVSAAEYPAIYRGWARKIREGFLEEEEEEGK